MQDDVTGKALIRTHDSSLADPVTVGENHTRWRNALSHPNPEVL
jgi:hypothetical protein